MGVILGNGRFYSPRSKVYAGMPSYGFPKLLLHLRVEHTDGSVSEIVSDETWKLTANGPIVANNEFDGEEYDARKELRLERAGFDDSNKRGSVPAPSSLSPPDDRAHPRPHGPSNPSPSLNRSPHIHL
jgi:alpha-L-rhamnosidase